MIEILIKLDVLELLLAGNTEQYPELEGLFHVYGSADLGKLYFLNDSQRERQAIDDYIEFSACRSKWNCALRFDAEPASLSPTSRLVFSLHAKSAFEGKEFLQPCGSACVTLAAMVMKPTHTLDIIDPHPSLPVKKGRVAVSFRLRDTQSAQLQRIFGKSSDTTDINELMRDTLFGGYVLRSLGLYFKPGTVEMLSAKRAVDNVFHSDSDQSIRRHYRPEAHYYPTVLGIQKIHCPFFKTDILGVNLPGFVYASVLPRSPPDEIYYENVMRCSLLSYEVTEAQFLRTISEMFYGTTRGETVDGADVITVSQCLNVIGTACSMYAQGQPYVPDHVNKHRNGTPFVNDDIEYVENMSNVRVTHGNDCEDLNQDACITARTIRDYKDWTSPILLASQKVLKRYTVMLAQCATQNTAADQPEEDDPPDDLTTHICCLMIPIALMNVLLSRTNTNPSLIALTTEGEGPWDKQLEVLFCEGTGRLNPVAKPPWQVNKTSTEEACKTKLRHQNLLENQHTRFSSLPFLNSEAACGSGEQFHSFYRYIVSAYLPMEDGMKACDLTFVYTNSKTYGIGIRDLVYDENMPGITINDTLTEAELKLARETLNVVHPVPQLLNRNASLVRNDILSLASAGFQPWDASLDMGLPHISYFASIDVIYDERLAKDLTAVDHPYYCKYKYYGLDSYTAMVELCVYYPIN